LDGHIVAEGQVARNLGRARRFSLQDTKKEIEMTHRIALQNVVQLTHDTRQYVFSRPPNFTFSPGQATELAIDRDGWRDAKRPFTFAGDEDANVLAFVIKSYPEREGVTAELASCQPGDHVLIGDPWGAIEDKGPGVFLAGGAGITPFIAILKARARKGDLDGCSLHFANKTEEDIILAPYWTGLEGLEARFLVSKPKSGGDGERLDADYLDAAITDWEQRFYVCGPPAMEEALVKHLKERGVPDDRIIREK
jgi:ferredoxin-NADP reductase